MSAGTSVAAAGPPAGRGSRDIVTATLADQWIGIPVVTIRDILAPQPLTRVPLAPPAIAGLLNLRGRIVTAIDLGRRLGVSRGNRPAGAMNVVVDQDGELYSLLVDRIGEVVAPPEDCFEADPGTLTPAWRQLAAGLYRFDDRLLVLLDVRRILTFADAA